MVRNGEYSLGKVKEVSNCAKKRSSNDWTQWIDWESGIAATLFLQVLPPFDSVVIAMFDELERAVYRGLVV